MQKVTMPLIILYLTITLFFTIKFYQRTSPGSGALSKVNKYFLSSTII